MTNLSNAFEGVGVLSPATLIRRLLGVLYHAPFIYQLLRDTEREKFVNIEQMPRGESNKYIFYLINFGEIFQREYEINLIWKDDFI